MLGNTASLPEEKPKYSTEYTNQYITKHGIHPVTQDKIDAQDAGCVGILLSPILACILFCSSGLVGEKIGNIISNWENKDSISGNIKKNDFPHERFHNKLNK